MKAYLLSEMSVFIGFQFLTPKNSNSIVENYLFGFCGVGWYNQNSKKVLLIVDTVALWFDEIKQGNNGRWRDKWLIFSNIFCSALIPFVTAASRAPEICGQKW